VHYTVDISTNEDANSTFRPRCMVKINLRFFLVQGETRRNIRLCDTTHCPCGSARICDTHVITTHSYHLPSLAIGPIMHDDCGTIVLRGPYWFAFYNFVALNSIVVVGVLVYSSITRIDS